jgi:hypothetical protein
VQSVPALPREVGVLANAARQVAGGCVAPDRDGGDLAIVDGVQGAAIRDGVLRVTDHERLTTLTRLFREFCGRSL